MKAIRGGLVLGIAVISLIVSEHPAGASKWWHRTASKAGKIEGIEYIPIGGRETAVVVRGKDQPIECPEGFWQSNSRTVPFCVNKSHSTYKDTPICLISLDCKQVKLSDYRIALWLNSEPLERNWQHYANAVNVGRVEERESLALGEVWPGTQGIQRSWGEVIALLCEGLSCQHLALGKPSLPAVATLNFAGLGMRESWPSLGDMAGSEKPVRLSLLPAQWFARQPLARLTDKLQLWEQNLEELGISQPTTGQLGLTYGQFQIVQAGGAASGLNGKVQLFYDNRRPSDNTNLKPSGQDEIITGSNRFIKNQCTVKGQKGTAYNNCANIVVRQNAAVPTQGGGYPRLILVTAHEEKLQELGGGDVIIHNTAINDLTPHNGDFRGPEVVGGTNDEPLIPPGNGTEIGINLDQCNPSPPTMAPLINTNTLVPAYPAPSSLCPNLFRKEGVQYQKQVFLFSQNGHDHLEAFIPRVCTPRQLYRLATDGRRIVAVRDIVVTACNSVPEATQAQGKRLTGQNVIHVFLRGGLLAKPE